MEQEGNKGNNGEWLDAASPMPVKVKKGGFVSFVVGLLKPSEVTPQHLEDYRKARGVDTNVVDRKGQQVVEVSVNQVTLPEEKKKP